MKALAAILILAMLGGCAALGGRTMEDKWGGFCNRLGHQAGSQEYADCMMTLVTAYYASPARARSARRPAATMPGMTRTEVDNAIREGARREQRRSQIMNHGMGGCTPNFSTGGCL